MRNSTSTLWAIILFAGIIAYALLSCSCQRCSPSGRKAYYREFGKPVVCTITDCDGNIIAMDTVPCSIAIGNDTLSIDLDIR